MRHGIRIVFLFWRLFMLKKAIVGFSITVFLLVALISCDFLGETNSEYGSLTVSTNTGETRTIEPTLEDLTITSYRVTGTGPGGESFEPVISSVSPITVDKLVVGSWSITVDGLNESGDIVQTTTQNVLIEATETTSATFNLDYPAGTGSLLMTIKWPQDVTSVYSITGTISPAVDEVSSYTAYASDAVTVDDMKTLTADFAGIPTGSYSLNVKFYNSEGTQIGLTMMEQINVYADLTSIGTFILPEYFFPVEAPTISPDGGRISLEQLITLETTTEGATIYFTTDGTEPSLESTEYSAPFTLPFSKTVKAIAVRDDMFASSVSSADFEVAVATPTFSVDAGTYESSQTVSITSATSGADIYYSTDGWVSQSLYETPIAISQNTTLEAIAVHESFGDSEIASAVYNIRTAPPSFSPRAGTYGSTQYVTLSSSVTGSTIYYTLDGEPPTASSLEYTSPLEISETTTVKAISCEDNMTNSIVASETYTIVSISAVSNPSFNPIAGSYSSPQTVTIATTTEGSTIYYTLDGTIPDQYSSVYTEPLFIDETMTIKAYAIKDGYVDSETVVADYVIQTATPTFSRESGVYSDIFDLTLSCSTPESSIFYTTDGSDPRVGGTLYDSPLSLTSTEETTITAYATRATMPDSELAVASYTIGGTGGIIIDERTHYTVSIQTPDDWNGEPVITDVYGNFSTIVSPVTYSNAQFSWYLDGELVSNSENLVLGDTFSETNIGTSKGLHGVSLKVEIDDDIYCENYLFSSSDDGNVGVRRTTNLSTQSSKYFPSVSSVTVGNGELALGIGTTDSNTGSVIIFNRYNGHWRDVATLQASDGEVNDWFGAYISMKEDLLIIGATGDDDNGTSSGSAYIFRKDAITGIWREEDKILASDGEAGDSFGRSIDICGDYAIVGAYRNDDNGSNSGSAYIFKYNVESGKWEEINKLIPTDIVEDDCFGFSVAISNDNAIVTAPFSTYGIYPDTGRAYVYILDDDGVWNQSQKIESDDWLMGMFGSAIAMDDDSLIVGAPNQSNEGRAYVFKLQDTGLWTGGRLPIASQRSFGDRYGRTVAISGDYAVVGAYTESDEYPNMAYLYRKNEYGVWRELHKLSEFEGIDYNQGVPQVDISDEFCITGVIGSSIDAGSIGRAYAYYLD